ncbi:MAG: hypothetical protein HeimC2_05080 [Candidatus Heimdallarchaeota archaeon LC_2]|nr:MAG: hypothetical protein HeimC2_05080 [Candidatus Heimdallarchaeota archaeon LC_2]
MSSGRRYRPYQVIILIIFVASIQMHIIPVIADVYEPDDSIGTATTLLSDSVQTHSIDPAGDVDYFNFTVSTISKVSIQTSGSVGDTYMILYDSDGMFINYNDDYSGLWAGMDLYLDPGTYIIRVEAYYSTDTIDSYNILLLVTPLTVDAFEPDDTISTATPLTSDNPQRHNLIPLDDVDYYSITLLNPEVINIWTSGIGDMYADTEMWLYDSNNVELDYNDDLEYNNEYSGISAYLNSGTYYVKVSESFWASYGEYDIQYTILPQPDAYEPDGSRINATSLLNGVAQSHSISPAYDVDQFTFSLDAFAKVTIWTSGSIGDTFMMLSDSNDMVIESNDDYGGLWAGMELYLDPGNYFVIVMGMGFGLFDYIDNYEMHLDITNISSDSYEPNDSFDTATLLLNNTMQTHNHIPVDDIDYFHFTVNKLSTVSIWTDGTEGDNVMWLYDSTGNSLKYNDDYNGLWAGLQVKLSPGEYILEISPTYFIDVIAEYFVHLLIIEDNMPTSSTTTTDTKNTDTTESISSSREYILDEDITILAGGGSRREIQTDAKGTLDITIKVIKGNELDMIFFESTTYGFGWYDPNAGDDVADALFYIENINSQTYSVRVDTMATYVIQIINNEFAEAQIRLQIIYSPAETDSGGLPIGLSTVPIVLALLTFSLLSIRNRKYE